MNIVELTREYTCTHDLRQASIDIYEASARAYMREFGDGSVEEMTQRSVLIWRKKRLDGGLAKRSWNTYASHLRTVYEFGIEHGLISLSINPFKKSTVIPPRRPKKTVVRDAISHARNWLQSLQAEERESRKRTPITPAWFWLTVFEMFYYTGLRLNALLSLAVADIDLERRLILVKGETEKTHREFMIPIPDGLMGYLDFLVSAALSQDFLPTDQLFNVNRFSNHYRGQTMNTNQVEAMYKKISEQIGVRMTPHRFRHTIASDLMRQPERNIHVTKMLLNHSNIATTMEYIEPDYDFMRTVLNDRVPHMPPRTYNTHVDHSPPPRKPPAKKPAADAIPLPFTQEVFDEEVVVPKPHAEHQVGRSTDVPSSSPEQGQEQTEVELKDISMPAPQEVVRKDPVRVVRSVGYPRKPPAPPQETKRKVGRPRKIVPAPGEEWTVEPGEQKTVRGKPLRKSPRLPKALALLIAEEDAKSASIGGKGEPCARAARSPTRVWTTNPQENQSLTRPINTGRAAETNSVDDLRGSARPAFGAGSWLNRSG